jgi:hypothetical protein
LLRNIEGGTYQLSLRKVLGGNELDIGESEGEEVGWKTVFDGGDEMRVGK